MSPDALRQGRGGALLGDSGHSLDSRLLPRLEAYPFRGNDYARFAYESGLPARRPGWYGADKGGYGDSTRAPCAAFVPLPASLLTARARPGSGRFLSPNKEMQLSLGSSKARALLGGVVVIAILGAVASEVGAGPAGAARRQTTKAEIVRPHGVRPIAAIRSTILEVTPLSLAADLATKYYRATTEQRAAIVRYVAGVEAAKAAAEAAAAQPPVEVRAERVTRDTAPTREASVGGDNADTLACIRAHESDSAGGYSAVNSSSGAGGAYQALPSTWDGYGGYARAQDAPAAVQDQWAHEAISASGTRPWAGSGC